MKDYNHVTLVGTAIDFESPSKSAFTFTVKALDDDLVHTNNIVVKAYNKLAEICEQYLRTSKKVLVDGKIHISKDNTAHVVASNIKILGAR
jgi:hypothetical protein